VASQDSSNDKVVVRLEDVDYSESVYKVHSQFFVNHDIDHAGPSIQCETTVADEVHDIYQESEDFPGGLAQVGLGILVFKGFTSSL
jgi:hypothetical protein